MSDNNSNSDTIQALKDIAKNQSFVSLNKFLQNYDLQEQNEELEENELNELCNNINSYRRTCESAILKLESNNPLKKVIDLLLNAYSFQYNQAEMFNEKLNEENEQLKNMPNNNDPNIEPYLTQINDLKTQLTQAKITIANYEAEEDAKERAIDNIIQSISDAFNLPSYPEDTDQLIDELHNIIDKNQGTIKNIIKTFDLPNETTTNDIIYHLKEKINSLNSSGLTEKLREQLLNTTNELEEAKREIKKLQNENQSQNTEKKQPTNYRSPNNNNTNANNTKNQNMPTEKQILACFEDIPLNSSDIPSILKSNAPLLDKLKRIASTLSLSAFSNESLQDEKKMLLSVVSAQYKFIKSLADSEKVYANIYASSEKPYEDIRQTLLAETESVHLFLQQHAIGIVEDSCLFEELLKREDSDILDNVQKYLEAYSRPSSIESEELFIMLLQAISAADVLRKYSSQLQIFNRQHEKDFKQMKSYSEQLEKSIDALNNSSLFVERTATIEDPNISMNNGQNTNENLTRTTISTMSPASTTTPKSNSRLTPKQTAKVTPKLAENQTQSNRSNFAEDQSVPNTNAKDNDYVKNLKKQISDLRKLNNELKEEKEQLKKKTHSDLILVQEQIDNMKDKYNQIIGQKKRANQTLSAAVKSSTDKIKELREENEDLKQRIEKARTRSIPEDNTSNLLIRDLQDQLEGTKKDYENVKIQMKKEISDYQTQKQNEFNEAISEKDKQIQDLQDQLEQSLINSKKISKRSQKLESDLQAAKKKIQELEKSEIDTITQADQLGKKYREIHDDLEKLEQTNEKLRNEIESSEDIHKRDKELLKTKYEHKINEMKIDHQADLNKLADEKNEENQKVLLEFAHAFPSYVDLSTPVTKESISKAIQKVKKSCQSDSRLQQKREILSNAKKSLNVDNDIEIPGAIATLLKKYDSLLNEAQTLSEGMNEYMQIQDWLNRVYVLCTGGVCQDVTNIEMERCVEEALVNAFGSTLLSRKVATLRAEKKLLVKNNENLKSKAEKKQKMSIRHLLIIAMLVLKAKTLSGHSDVKKYSFVNTDAIPVGNSNNTGNRLETQQAAPMSSFIYSVD